jgi:small subunit ribosomal protein S6
MKQYELVVLLHPDLEIDLDNPLKKIESLVNQHGGKISQADVWGKRKLAYTVGKEDFAVYVYYELELPGESVTKFERAMNITDEVLRYLLTYPVPKSERDKKNASKGDEPEEDSSSDEEDK